jgi:error-prone DNA polymerase
MKQIEVQLREGMARQGIVGEPAEAIIKSIASFALYGFPESHSASFALLVYASAYLKAHFPSAFYAALLNNQPMGFYHPATLVKDAQRRGVHFLPVDVQQSSWDCTVEGDGRIRLGLRYVAGLRAAVGQAIGSLAVGRDSRPGLQPASQVHAGVACPKCHCDDPSMIELVEDGRGRSCFCNSCAHEWKSSPSSRFRSIEDLVARTGINREELSVLAEIGALSAFGYSRREALWQVERAIRPAGALFEQEGAGTGTGSGTSEPGEEGSPLPEMTEAERVVADYEGTGLTIGAHPMAIRRAEMMLRGALRASDLPQHRNGARVRVAGSVITRQRPGTAKGFVFLTLEDETGIANIIVRPDLFARDRMTIIGEPFLLVEGMLQNQEGVTSVKAERVEGLGGRAMGEARDFH